MDTRTTDQNTLQKLTGWLLGTPLGRQLVSQAERSEELAAKRRQAIARRAELIEMKHAGPPEALHAEAKAAGERLQRARQQLREAKAANAHANGGIETWKSAIESELGQLEALLQTSAPAELLSEVESLGYEAEMGILRGPGEKTSTERWAEIQALRDRRAALRERMLGAAETAA